MEMLDGVRCCCSGSCKRHVTRGEMLEAMNSVQRVLWVIGVTLCILETVEGELCLLKGVGVMRYVLEVGKDV